MTTSNRLKRLDALTGRLQDQLRDPSVARHERRETLRKRLNLVTALLTKELKTKTSPNVPTAVQPSTQEKPARMYGHGDTVYARHDINTHDGKLIPTGTRGTVTKLYQRMPNHGWSCDVDFVGKGVGWYFESELTWIEPTKGIRISHRPVVPPGAPMPPTLAEVRSALIESGHKPLPIDEPPTTTPVPIQQKAPQMPVTPEAPPCHPKSKKVTASQHTSAPSTTQVWQPPQVYLGNITGATGDAFAFGAALGFDDTLFYLNLVGSKTAVESVWAQLDLGRDLKIISLEHKTEYPLLGEKAGFKRFQRSLITGAEHLLILHKDIAETTYPDTHQTVVFYPDHAQAVARMAFHITQLVTVPVFPEWHDYLWRLGEAQRLITPCKCLGVNKPYCYRLLLSRKRWTDLICAGLKNKAIHLPA